MIVADTSALVALLNADDRHHDVVRDLWERDPDAWVIPWAVLPELDYMVRRHLGARPAELFLGDVATGGFIVEHGQASDLIRAAELDSRHRDLGLGLVDGVVAAVSERLHAQAIATLDVRHFGVLELSGSPDIYPRDL
ncbi:hypothetical protein BH23GEM9_BH23GEM9_34580 [soil metagenome]